MKEYKTKNMNLQLFAGDTITDLTGTSWVFNDVLISINHDFSINFYSNSLLYNQFNCSINSDTYILSISYVATESTKVYRTNVGWRDVNYKTITITGGSDTTNSDLIN